MSSHDHPSLSLLLFPTFHFLSLSPILWFLFCSSPLLPSLKAAGGGGGRDGAARGGGEAPGGEEHAAGDHRGPKADGGDSDAPSARHTGGQ